MVLGFGLPVSQSYTVHVSHLEIYNEELSDLLEPDDDEVRVCEHGRPFFSVRCPWLLRAVFPL